MEKIKLYRKRYIPDEIVYLANDTIAHLDDDIIVTTWKTLKPRKDFAYGTSIYLLIKTIRGN